ncbi:MAG TPA: hypothetical protein DCE41_26765 [Cytophagales bacterium]|nr:hypothetical protein [Cytophagales bacterium]HAA21878.1 hypothetical protein [Cytophagales bacterium]HAP58263.1 hypothetical protein [Cytophagales bacterium]
MEAKIVTLLKEEFEQQFQVEINQYLPENGVVNFVRLGNGLEYKIHLRFDLKFRSFYQVSGLISNSAISQLFKEAIGDLMVFDTAILFLNKVPDWQGHMQGMANYDLTQLAGMDGLLKRLVQYIVKFIIPFFDSYSKLVDINEMIINGIPESEYKDYIPGQEKNLKVLSIMKLCGNLRYDAFKEKVFRNYEKGAAKNPERYGKHLQALKNLTSHLESFNLD